MRYANICQLYILQWIYNRAVFCLFVFVYSLRFASFSTLVTEKDRMSKRYGTQLQKFDHATSVIDVYIVYVKWWVNPTRKHSGGVTSSLFLESGRNAEVCCLLSLSARSRPDETLCASILLISPRISSLKPAVTITAGFRSLLSALFLIRHKIRTWWCHKISTTRIKRVL